MAQLLKRELNKVPKVKLMYPVEANGVFVRVPSSAIPKLLKRYFFYPWNLEESVVRWMCSWDTTEKDVKEFVEFVRKTLASHS
jgi:threonine aldolase